MEFNTLSLEPKYIVKIPPKEFTRLKACDSHKYKEIKFVPPSLKDSHFGYFEAKLKTPYF